MSSDAALVPKTPPRAANKNRLCRNIIIHGFCKYENKGCEFNHNKNGSAQSGVSEATSAMTKLRVDSPVFTPTKTGNDSTINNLSFSQRASASPTPTLDPGADGQRLYNGMDSINPYAMQKPVGVADHPMLSHHPSHGLLKSVPSDMQNPYYQPNPMDGMMFQQQQQVGMTSAHEPLQYHLYAPPLPHVSSLPPHQKTIHAFFMSDKLREDLQRRTEATLVSIDPTSPEAAQYPAEVHVYNNLYPLDENKEKNTKVFGLPTSVYRSTSSVDGKSYCLRRVEGFRLTNEAAMSNIDVWRRIRSANIVSLREAFTTRVFGDHSLVFVYDFHPLAQTLYQVYFAPYPHGGPGLPERVLWSYVVQLVSCLKTIHGAGLAARVIEPSKILITGKNRIRLNCCGMFDTLTYDGTRSSVQHQQEDLLHLGQLIVALCCGALGAVHNLAQSVEYIGRQYSADVRNVIMYLLSKPTTFKSIDDVITMMGPRLLTEINSAYYYNDILENELTRELENGRLFRLLCKAGFINERPEFDMDASWSETGDRYLLKLFRDYVFHQVDEKGNPILDLAHIVQCLNKLDVGVDEKVMLMSRDEQSCLIVTYKDLHQCMENAFQELLKSKYN
ncbi:uncharacterized protein BJ171DRAFT_507112 [Polychytrium aggregatum]|uniref:uncharacterized protein n=1 Tax=Polychytrium aggregatum TaxID=110093 RepID=UPI0022FDB67A|nr:uncharacterized protein BJ171DRAFT_507112 [Polychytrium aggregatum]KAI9203946.1 hypothetical protein BJ171DRAFT_507112 [Polychytrium aggregatum]